MTNIQDENSQKSVFVDEKTQNELNAPLSSHGVAQKNKGFLEAVISLIHGGKVNLFRPETLLNLVVYNKLPVQKRGKVDIEAVNLLSALREIDGLHNAGLADTYQMQYLVDKIRNAKERLEIQEGDIFII